MIEIILTILILFGIIIILPPMIMLGAKFLDIYCDWIGEKINL